VCLGLVIAKGIFEFLSRLIKLVVTLSLETQDFILVRDRELARRCNAGGYSEEVVAWQSDSKSPD
jgi:hypothetical protein